MGRAIRLFCLYLLQSTSHKNIRNLTKNTISVAFRHFGFLGFIYFRDLERRLELFSVFLQLLQPLLSFLKIALICAGCNEVILQLLALFLQFLDSLFQCFALFIKLA